MSKMFVSMFQNILINSICSPFALLDFIAQLGMILLSAILLNVFHSLSLTSHSQVRIVMASLTAFQDFAVIKEFVSVSCKI